MPKSTFLNLSSDKKGKIIQCAKAEFSMYGFYQSSINRIIKKAEISRGSFYQYFEDKEDLYMYLLQECGRSLLQGTLMKLKKSSYDVFELQSILFDYITIDAMNSKDQEFIITAISNMDMKLASHLLIAPDSMKELMPFLKVGEIMMTSEQMSTMIQLLIMSLTNELVAYFNQIKSLEDCRKTLLQCATIMKYGVISS